jgi:mRNA interferase MazF
MTGTKPSRGDVWLLDLDPTRGHEQAGKRPGLIVSADPLNHGPAGLVIIVPLTTRERGIPFHVRIDPDEGGLRQVSFAKCEDVRSVAAERLMGRIGRVSPGTMEQVEEGLRILLNL